MTGNSEQNDVLLVADIDAIKITTEVELRFLAAGLAVVNLARRTSPKAGIADQLRTELGLCSAIVVVLGDMPRLSASLAFEIGVAWAWEKPIYAVTHGTFGQPNDLPGFVRQVPMESLDQMIDEIKTARTTLTTQERNALTHAYQTIGVPTDRLLDNPATVDNLVTEYKRVAGTKVRREHLIRELLTLRKYGRLPRLNSKFRGTKQPA